MGFAVILRDPVNGDLKSARIRRLETAIDFAHKFMEQAGRRDVDACKLEIIDDGGRPIWRAMQYRLIESCGVAPGQSG